MDSYTPEKVINGTYGEVWFDDQYMAETTACKGEIDIDNQEVTQTGAGENANCDDHIKVG